jgi:hypothetical protein
LRRLALDSAFSLWRLRKRGYEVLNAAGELSPLKQLVAWRDSRNGGFSSHASRKNLSSNSSKHPPNPGLCSRTALRISAHPS